jgi:hypothetical protein
MKRDEAALVVKRRHFLKLLSAFCMLPGMPTFVFGKDIFSERLATTDDTSQTAAVKIHFRRQDPKLAPMPINMLESIVKRLSRFQDTVGYANFCLFNFDDMRRTAKSYTHIGEFPTLELEWLEKLFYSDVNRYGFHGKKTFQNITDRIDKNLTQKIPGTGNYLYKGMSIDIYHKLSRDVGSQLILTAGVRGIVKQFYLFLSRALRHNGNLSVACRTIAPPGYSFHAMGDFDVGKIGFGVANFSDRFTQTDVYATLKSLDYVKFRYPPGNPTGIVFEPWHIQVV